MMSTEDYLDKALKYARERYDERHYEDTEGLHDASDWAEDYGPWAEMFSTTRMWYLESTHSPRPLSAFLDNPLHKMVIEAAKILVEEKGL